MNESSPLSLEHFQSHPPLQFSPRPRPALTSHSRHYSSHLDRRQLSPVTSAITVLPRTAASSHQSQTPLQFSPGPAPALTSHSRHYSSPPDCRQLSPASFQEAPVWALCFFYLFSQFSFSAARVVLFNVRYIISLPLPRASLVAQLVKNLPAMWEPWVQSLGWKIP